MPSPPRSSSRSSSETVGGGSRALPFRAVTPCTSETPRSSSASRRQPRCRMEADDRDRGSGALVVGAGPMTLRAVVVDDEKHARDRLKRLLKEEDVLVVGECRNGRDAVAVIRDRQPDIVFLDVQMPG